MFAVWAATFFRCLAFPWCCPFLCRWIHAVEVAFESIQVIGPEPTERSQPGIRLLKWLRFQPVETALSVHRGFHETGLSEHPQVLGHSRLRHTKLALDLSHRLLGGDEEAQNRAAVRFGNDFEYRFHILRILHSVYTCQGIFTRRLKPAALTMRAIQTGRNIGRRPGPRTSWSV